MAINTLHCAASLLSSTPRLSTLTFGYVVLLCFLPACAPITLDLERVSSERVQTLDQLKALDEERHQEFVDFPLLSSPSRSYFGFYFTKIKIGNPPREFKLLVDTGSSITWVSCIPCTGCPNSDEFKHHPSLYDPHNSTSASTISCSDKPCKAIHRSKCSSRGSDCPYESGYVDGSHFKGYLVSDIFNLDMVRHSEITNRIASVVFGCTNFRSHTLTQVHTDGILALAPSEISIISQLASQGAAPSVFSHCLNGGNNARGKLVLGEIREPGMVYTPLDTSRHAYGLHMRSIAINGQVVPINPSVFSSKRGKTFVDSGTSLVVLADEAYNIFIPLLTSVLSQSSRPVVSNGNQCFEVSSRIDEIFPTVSFNFKGGASMILKPKDYLLWITHFEGVHKWCLGFQKSKKKSLTILGDLVLKDKIIVYDLARKQLGWVDYDCSQAVNVSVTAHRSASSSLADSIFISILTNIVAFFIYISLFG